MQVGIERRAEAMDEGDGAEARGGARTGAARTQVLLHRPQEQAQSSTLEIGIAVQSSAGAWYCEQPR